MDSLYLNFNYKGANIEGEVWPEEDYTGWTYKVELKDYINFRMSCDDDGEWTLLRDGNAMAPNIEPELMDKLTEAITDLQHSE